MVYLRKILVTTDLSDHSLAAMDHASSFGLLYASDLYLLYVVDHGHASRGRHGTGDGKEAEHAALLEDARRSLTDFIEKNLNPDVRVIPVVREGHPAHEITKFADAEGVDLIVIATHGRTGLKHMLMGSVAEKTVRFSRVPVLTVKPFPMRDAIIDEEDVVQELHIR
jgi:nucleotide-binding universal stress UspA family protein